MAGREMVAGKRQGGGGGSLDLREIAARTTLREVRQRGHAYVELRRAGTGKRAIFFCTLCLTPCYSEAVLFDHLHGSLHARRYEAARLTLLGPCPWPFNDGVLFFHDAPEKDGQLSSLPSPDDMALVVQNDNGVEVTSKWKENGSNGFSNHVDDHCHDSNGAGLEIVPYGQKSSLADRSRSSSHRSYDGSLQVVAKGHRHSLIRNGNMSLAVNGHNGLIVPGVLIKDDVSSLVVRFMGFGQIESRVQEIDEVRCKIIKIWCAWLGDGSFDDDDDDDSLQILPKCDFGIVCFSYTYDLGRKVGLDDESVLLLPGPLSEIVDVDIPGKQRKRSFSDPEDSSESPRDHSVSNGDDCSGMSDCSGNGPHQLHASRLLSGKALRRELRKSKRAAERICDICGQPMLPGKDVATLLNLKTGNLACSSRNMNGAFHLFHASCLIHWILLCEFETYGNQSANKKTNRRRKGKASLKKHISKPISSVFCPECQGTGACVEGDELEKPSISLCEMFLHKLKAIEAHKAWMKNPEVLQKCSTGLHLTSEPLEDPQERVVPLKLVSFYRADE